MTTKSINLELSLSPATAMELVEVLDQLRDVVAFAYLDEIQQMMREHYADDSDQIELPFNDPVDF